MHDVMDSPPQNLVLGKTERVIKKATNRRLYDYRRCSYIKFTDFPSIVRETPEVLVIERTSNRDITHNVFHQVVSSFEFDVPTPAFTQGFLKQLLSLEQWVPRGLLATFLEQAIWYYIGQLEYSGRPLVHPIDPAVLAEHYLKRWSAREGEIIGFLEDSDAQAPAPEAG